MPPEKVQSIRREPSDVILKQLAHHVDPHFDFNTPQGRELIRFMAAELIERRQTMRDIELRASAMQVTPCPR